MTASGDVLQVYEDLFRVEYACITFTKGRSSEERNHYTICWLYYIIYWFPLIEI